MLPDYLLPETVSREDGDGPTLPTEITGGPVLVTLGVTQAIEKESLDVAVWGSTDGESWGAKPLLEFPHTSYCGRYSLPLNLAAFPGIRKLKAGWKMRTWGRPERSPLFSFYIQLQPTAKAQAAAS